MTETESGHLILSPEEIAELADDLLTWEMQVAWINEDFALDLMTAGALLKVLLKNGVIKDPVDLPPIDELDEKKPAAVLKLVRKDYPKKPTPAGPDE
jgi:hypothetical protein